MKCIKCGYTSFDYLSECRKCGTSLAAARDVLGFSATKPEIQSLLGSLLGDFLSPVKQAGEVAEPAISASFDFGEGLTSESNLIKPETAVGQPASPILGPDEGDEDFSLLDLSDDELELLIEKEPEGGETKPISLGSDSDAVAGKAPEPVSFVEPFPPTAESAAVPVKDVQPGFDQFEIEEAAPELQAAQFEGGGKAKEETGDLVIDFLEDPFSEPDAGAKGSPAGLEAKPPKTEPHPDKTSDDDFVIELSENDLDALLAELGSSSEEADEGNNKK